MEVSVTQAAALLSKSERTIQRYIKEGRLKSRQLPGHRTVVNVEDLETLRGETIDIEGILSQLDSLQQEVDQLKQIVSALQDKLDTLSAGTKPYEVKPPRDRIIREASTASERPAGESVPARTFAEEHGFTRDQMAGWIRRGEIDATPQPYGKEGSKRQYVLTKEQQQAALSFWQSLEASE